MPSAYEPALFAEALTFAPPALLDEPPDHAPNLNDAIEQALRFRRVALTQQHRDLDATVCALCEADTGDELLIKRLKKRRLRLKDEIARIEGLLPAWRLELSR